MTYIYADLKDGNPVFRALYSQWNHVPIQPYKIVRFLEVVKMWNKNKCKYLTAFEFTRAYEFAAALSPSGFAGFMDDTDCYNKDFGMYDEDNNNGWTIVYITRDLKKEKYVVNIGFKAGSEDMDERNPISTYMGWNAYAKYTKNNEYELEVKKWLSKINASFDADIINEVEHKIRACIHDTQQAKQKKG